MSTAATCATIGAIWLGISVIAAPIIGHVLRRQEGDCSSPTPRNPDRVSDPRIIGRDDSSRARGGPENLHQALGPRQYAQPFLLDLEVGHHARLEHGLVSLRRGRVGR